jgi:5-formyltetrahydrofolate cyclo-ligase
MQDDAKQLVRTQVWNALDAAGAVYDDTAHGRIPNFRGSEEAAARLAELERWKDAVVVKAVPDKAQLPVRARALEEGKLVYMAVPKLASAKPFYLLDPAALDVPAIEAATSKVAATIAPTVEVDAGADTLVVTTVHSLQVIDTPIPVTDHDVNVDLVITPEEVITCPSPRRPGGILWAHLDESKIAEIPALQARAKSADA